MTEANLAMNTISSAVDLVTAYLSLPEGSYKLNLTSNASRKIDTLELTGENDCGVKIELIIKRGKSEPSIRWTYKPSDRFAEYEQNAKDCKYFKDNRKQFYGIIPDGCENAEVRLQECGAEPPERMTLLRLAAAFDLYTFQNPTEDDLIWINSLKESLKTLKR